MNDTPRLVALGLALVGVATPIVLAQDALTPSPGETPRVDGSWTQWRGPGRDGHCPGPTWPDALTDERLTPVWRVDGLGPSYAGPIVTPDLVFSFESRDETHEIVRAFDRATGEERWRTQWDGAMEVPFYAAKNGSWVRSTPAFDGARLYLGGMEDVVVCLDAATGDVVWKVDFKSLFGTPVDFGLICSPLVEGDAVYVHVVGGFVKLDKETGAVVWRTLEDVERADSSAFSSPVFATIAGSRQLLVLARTELCGVAAEDGAVLWRQPIKSFRGMNILTPVAIGDDIFTAPYGGRAQRLRVSAADGTFTVTPEWDNSVQGYMTSPVVVDGHAYLFSRANRFTCIDLATGDIAWTSGPTGDSYQSLIAQGKRILALSDTGTLRLLEANPDAFTVLGEVEVADDKTWAHLAVAGDQLVIREEHGLAIHRWK